MNILYISAGPHFGIKMFDFFKNLSYLLLRFSEKLNVSFNEVKALIIKTDRNNCWECINNIMYESILYKYHLLSRLSNDFLIKYSCSSYNIT